MPQPLERLLSPTGTSDDAITSNDLDNLRQAGFVSVESIVYATRKSMLEVRGISLRKYELIFKRAIELCSSMMGFKSAQTIHKEREERLLKISTGSNKFDALLDGGIELGSLTEVYGSSGSGKTQLCHTLAVTCQLPIKQGGCGIESGRCIFIDTEGTFRPRKIKDIARRYGLNQNECLENILVASCHNSEHQEMLIRQAASIVVKNKYSLIVVDSISHTLRNEYIGLDQLAPRQQQLAKQLRLLKDLASINNCACLITNQMVDEVSSLHQSSGSKSSPVGGHVLAHASTSRIYLSRSSSLREATDRVCRITKSPYLPEEETVFSITDFGIRDRQVLSIELCPNQKQNSDDSESSSIANDSNNNEVSIHLEDKPNEEIIELDAANDPVEEISFTQVMTQPRPGREALLTSKRRFIGTLPPQALELVPRDSESSGSGAKQKRPSNSGALDAGGWKSSSDDDDDYNRTLQEFKKRK